ncbi:MAG: GHMP kinase [Planctomycetota bacterium]
MPQAIQTRAFARAGLVGNPSDGYFGKTISIIVRDFGVTATLTPAERLTIEPSPADLCDHDSVDEFLRHTKLMGYYGALRLMKAAVARFHTWADAAGHDLAGRGNFKLAFTTDIPRLVGLSGSSAIVVATLRALEKFYGVMIPMSQMPTVALETETKELHIAAGLQDRVVQTYEGIVFMDFDRKLVEETGGGRYESLTPEVQPPIYVAFDAERAEVSDVAHRNLRAAWEAGEKDVVQAMTDLRDLTDRGRAALLAGDVDELHEVTNANFDIRKKIMSIAPENQRMIDTARAAGVSAKFAGSGGAIVGVYRNDAEYAAAKNALAGIGCTTFKPTIFAEAQS